MLMYNCVSKGSLGNAEAMNSERNLFLKRSIYCLEHIFGMTAEDRTVERG